MSSRPNPARRRSRRAWPVAASCVLAALVLDPTARGEEELVPADGVVREAIDVPLRSVRVIVRDRSGDPVPGLVPEDFVLRHDGEPLAIVGVDVLSESGPEPLPEDDPDAVGPAKGGALSGSLAADSEPGRPGDQAAAAQPRTLAIYVDPAFLAPGDLADFGPLLRNLAEAVAARTTDRWALIVAHRGLRLVAGPTHSPADLAEAWEAFPLGPGESLALQSEARALLRDIESAAAGGPDLAPRTRELVPLSTRTRVENYAAAAEAATNRVIRRMERVLTAAAGLDDRTEVVVVGGRLPGAAVEQLRSAWLSAFGSSSSWWMERGVGGAGGGFGTGGASSAIGREVDPPAISMQLEIGPLLDPLVERAGAVGVVMHAIDAGALRSVGPSFLERSAFDSIRQRGGSAGPSVVGLSGFGDGGDLGLVAERTGGVAVTGHRDFLPILTDRDPDGSYLVSFRPPRVDDEVHTLDVRIEGRRGLTVSHPSSYRAEGAEDAVGRRLVSALLLGLPDHDPLGFELELEAIDGGHRVRVALPLDRIALVPERDAHVGSLSAFFGWGGPDSGVSGVRRARIPVRIPNEELLTALGQSAGAVLPVDVPDGVSLLGVTLWDELKAESGTRTLEIVRALEGAVGTPDDAEAPNGNP